MWKRLLLMRQIPLNPNLGRLVLRLAVFVPLFMKHGIEKLFTFGAMSQHYLDPVGIGPVPTLVIAMISDGICSILLIIGLGTRWAALYSLCNLFVAWSVVHHFALMTRKDGAGETIFIYMAACLTLFLIGPGKYSVDAWIAGAKEEHGVPSTEASAARA